MDELVLGNHCIRNFFYEVQVASVQESGSVSGLKVIGKLRWIPVCVDTKNFVSTNKFVVKKISDYINSSLSASIVSISLQTIVNLRQWTLLRGVLTMNF